MRPVKDTSTCLCEGKRSWDVNAQIAEMQNPKSISYNYYKEVNLCPHMLKSVQTIFD